MEPILKRNPDGSPDIPEGWETVRFKVEGDSFEIAVPEEEREALIEKLGEMGASLLSEEGFDLDRWEQPAMLGDGGIREALARLGEVSPEDFGPTPLQRVPRPRRPADIRVPTLPVSPPSSRRVFTESNERGFQNKVDKRRRKKKMAKKSRKKNRK